MEGGDLASVLLRHRCLFHVEHLLKPRKPGGFGPNSAFNM